MKINSKYTITISKSDKPEKKKAEPSLQDKVTLGENSQSPDFLKADELKSMQSSQKKKHTFARVLGGVAGTATAGIAGLSLAGIISSGGAFAAAACLTLGMGVSSAIYFSKYGHL